MALTKADFDEFEKIMDVLIDRKLDEKLDERLKYLPTKEEFYIKTDELIKELRDMREELTVMNGRVSIHSDQIEDLQKIHPNGKHKTN
jgi:hypothetical protein